MDMRKQSLAFLILLVAPRPRQNRADLTRMAGEQPYGNRALALLTKSSNADSFHALVKIARARSKWSSNFKLWILKGLGKLTGHSCRS